jgi:O-antigen ligase
MDGITHQPGPARLGYWPLATLGLAAALGAVSLVAVGDQGFSGGKLALLGSGLLALAVFSALLWSCPLVVLVIAMVFTTSPIPLALSLPQSALVSAFLLSAAVVGFALRTPWRSLVPDPMLLPMGMFALYGVVSAAHGYWVGNELSYLAGDCFQLIEFAAVYFLVAQLLKTGGAIRMLMCWVLGSMLVTIVVELTLSILGSDAGGLLPSWEASSQGESLVRTIDIDATILFTILINLYPLLRASKHRRLIWLALIPTVANIALSLARGLWLCTLIAMLVSLLLQSRRARARLLKAAACLAVSVAILAAGWKVGSGSDDSLMDVFAERIFHGVDQVQEGFAGTESLATRRFLEMVIVGPQVLDRPWFGYGLGATYIIGGFAVLDAGTKGLIDHHFIHNLYLGTTFRMGLAGLALLLWVLFTYFRRILSAYRRMPSGSNQAGLNRAGLNRGLIAGVVASLVGQLFLSITQPTVVDHPTCVLIAGAMALSFRLAACGGSAGTGAEHAGTEPTSVEPTRVEPASVEHTRLQHGV